MNRLILTLVSILLFIYLFFSMLSFHGDYCAQRELWGINHEFGLIALHQESTPDYMINQLADRYQTFIKKYNGSIYAEQAELMRGDLYSFRKDFTQARLEYQKVIGPDKELSAHAEFGIAKTYELEGHWDKALATYKVIIQNYPVTSLGFSIPMYLTGHLVPSGDQKAYVDEAYGVALAFYQKIALQYPKSELEYSALRMIAICQLYQNNWSATITTLGEIVLKHPGGKGLQEAVSGINILCVTKSHNYDAAISIYEQFIQKYPEHPAVGLLKKMIKDFKFLKSKNLIIQMVPSQRAAK